MFKKGEKHNGFVVIDTKILNDIDSEGIVFEHEKTGAKLLYLKNKDDNKVFTISFRTPPKDSTGVAHILEHSVLCGSKKFPTKEPFVELAKGSLNTFLNAFTFPDKTMYPVASRNQKDFSNLMDVYLDAVFNPNIYKYPEIMMQEGWHYELEKKEDELTYKGVVYNEMKGAFSSPESILFRKISESLFPDTAYGVESGGDPEVIPKLTQEQFTEFHKKYYHPSNSYIFLYGDIDIEEKLDFINENYLNDYEKIKVDSSIEVQKPYSSIEETIINYPVASNEKEEDKTFLSLNFVAGLSSDPEITLGFEILEHLLLETPGSPLKRALIDANIGKDVFGTYEGSILQPIFSIVVKNSNEEKKQLFKDVVFETLNSLVTKGIDKRLIEASINIKEFQLREADYQGYPKGLIYSMKCMDSWLYDQCPFAHLGYEETLNKIKEALTTDYFEKMIKKYIIDNSHGSMLIVKPEKGLGEKNAEALKKELAEYKKSLSPGDLDKIINNTKLLKQRQLSKDSKEDLEKIPLLTLSDINRNPEKLPMVEKSFGGIKVIHCPVPTNKIAYFNMYFDLEVIDKEDIPYLSILSSALGKLNTDKYSYEDLVKELNIYTGGIRYSTAAYGKNGSWDEFIPKFSVKSKVLQGNIEKLLELLQEILTSTDFDNRKRLKEIVQETKSRMEMIMFDRGHIVAANHLLSYFSPQGVFEELTSGVSFYKFIANLEENFENKAEDLIKKLKEISSTIFNGKSLILGVTAEDNEYNCIMDNFSILYEKLSKNRGEKQSFNFDLVKKNEGLTTSGKVQYVAKAYNYIKLGYKYTGAMLILKTINNYDYLWNKVRVQGGAYGGFSAFQRNGNMFYTSYRDPNLIETLKVYDEAGSYFKEFNTDSRQMTKYIIGTISDLDFPLSPAMKGERAIDNYFKNISYEDIQRERLQVLDTKVEDIRAFGDMIEMAMKENNICVFGSEEKIKENKDVFDNIINVFE